MSIFIEYSNHLKDTPKIYITIGQLIKENYILVEKVRLAFTPRRNIQELIRTKSYKF
jgi:hypothetical protein